MQIEDRTCILCRAKWGEGNEGARMLLKLTGSFLGDGGGLVTQSFLTFAIPWTEEPDGLKSMESQRVGHD